GLDLSTSQLAANPFRPIVRADMTALPFRDGSFAEVTHLWCLYHLEGPTPARPHVTTTPKSCPRATRDRHLTPRKRTSLLARSLRRWNRSDGTARSSRCRPEKKGTHTAATTSSRR